MEQNDKYQLKANPKCKDCYGKGWVIWLVKDKTGHQTEEKRICKCVKRRRVEGKDSPTVEES